MRVFPCQKCCADSLSVCPTPVCIRTHTNDHVRTLQMSELGGLRKHGKDPALSALVGLGSAALAAAIRRPSVPERDNKV